MENEIELLGYYGSDRIIAGSAWTSTSRDITPDKESRIPALVKNLWENGHHTPFEKANVHFLVNTDIATHIHLLKHRTAHINGESARYKELKEDKFYLPKDWADIESSSQIGYKSNYISIDPQLKRWVDILEDYTKLGNILYHQSLKDLEPKLGRKRSKESARYFKTYNSQIQADVQFDMRNFGGFLKLRYDDHAQSEIYDIAHKMLDLVKNIEGNPFEHTIKSWGY